MMGNARQPLAMVAEAPVTVGTSSAKITFSSHVESKIQKDEAQPSLFVKGPMNPENGHRCTSHTFYKAQDNRWEGPIDPIDHVMFDNLPVRPILEDDIAESIRAARKRAFDLHAEVVGWTKNNRTKHENDFFLSDARTQKIPLEGKRPDCVKVGTDCSGLEAPFIALRNMSVPYEHVFSCDNDANVQKTILANHTPSRLYSDIKFRDVKTDCPYVDVYVAGFPCQPFSVAGKQQGFNDSKGRGNIFHNVREYISVHHPKVFILENVKGLVKMENGRNLKKILKLLRQVTTLDGSSAYEVHHKVLDTKEHGVPHSRPRWYCVGIRKDVARQSFVFPEPVSCPTIDAFLDNDSNRSDVRNIPTANKTMLRNIKSAHDRILKSGGSLEDPHVLDCDAGVNNVTCTHNFSPCITRSRNKGHWLLHKNRRMNIKEMMRLQGINPTKFVVDVSECTLGQQIGNAMSVNVIERVLNQALQAAGLTRKGCLKGKLNPTRDRWANDEGFNEVRSPCRSVSQLNATINKDRLMWAPVGSAMSVRQRFREFLIDSGASYHLIIIFFKPFPA